MQNSGFLAALGERLTDDEYLWACAFAASPDQGQWAGRYYRLRANQAQLIDAASGQNTYFCPAILTPDETGAFKRTKRNFKRLAALGADDANPADVNGRLSWVVETSPGKRQMGILLDADDPDCANLPLVDAVMQALADAGLIKADKSGNNAVRYMRLPVGTNTKDRPTGPFAHRLEHIDLSARYSLEDACAAFGLDLAAIRDGVKEAPTGERLPTGTDHASLIAALSADAGERSYHDPLMKLSAKLVTAGLHGGAVVEHLRGLMLAVRPQDDLTQLGRWQTRYDEIPRLVTSAEQFRTRPIEIALGEPDSGLLLDLAELEKISANVRWLIKGLVPADSMGMLFGASGAFKSFLALDLALHVANEMRWCDRKTTNGSVVYVAAEGGAGIYRRVAAWHQKHKLPQTKGFHVCITPLLLTLEDQVKQLADAIRALPQTPALVVIDTLSQTFSGDENAATDIADYIRLLNTYIRAEFGCTVTILHHTGHAASERPRGSSAITANLDFLLGCFRPDADALAAQLEVIKQKDGDKLDSQHFELEREVLGEDTDGEEVSSLVAVYHNIVETLKRHAEELTDQQRAVLDIMSYENSTTADQMIEVLAEMTNEKAARRNVSRVVDRLIELRLIKPTGTKRWRRV